MSASEKLRSLATAWRTGEYDMVTVKPTTVLDALPQIVAVVEAAETVGDFIIGSEFARRQPYMAACVLEVRSALATLDEALEEGK